MVSLLCLRASNFHQASARPTRFRRHYRKSTLRSYWTSFPSASPHAPRLHRRSHQSHPTIRTSTTARRRARATTSHAHAIWPGSSRLPSPTATVRRTTSWLPGCWLCADAAPAASLPAAAPSGCCSACCRRTRPDDGTNHGPNQGSGYAARRKLEGPDFRTEKPDGRPALDVLDVKLGKLSGIKKGRFVARTAFTRSIAWRLGD
jgi:hypothetical protein